MGKVQHSLEERSCRGDIMSGAQAAPILAACGGSLDPLVKALNIGLVRGLVGLVGGDSPRDGGLLAALARELVRQDVLVLAAGGAVAVLEADGVLGPTGVELAGAGLTDFCGFLDMTPALSLGEPGDAAGVYACGVALAGALGVAVDAAPVLVAREEASGSLGLYAVAEGLPVASGDGEPADGWGAAFLVTADPARAAEAVGRAITTKRLALGLNDRYDGTVYS